MKIHLSGKMKRNHASPDIHAKLKSSFSAIQAVLQIPNSSFPMGFDSLACCTDGQAIIYHIFKVSVLIKQTDAGTSDNYCLQLGIYV
jgi:hypothetical protein